MQPTTLVGWYIPADYKGMKPFKILHCNVRVGLDMFLQSRATRCSGAAYISRLPKKQVGRVLTDALTTVC